MPREKTMAAAGEGGSMSNSAVNPVNPAVHGLRPVVAIVVAAEVFVAALLLTTVQLPTPQSPSAEIASLR